MAKDADEFQTWLSILMKDKKRVRHFDLFGTRAAVLWNDGDTEVYVISITSFSGGVPQTNKYDYFWYNLGGGYWSGKSPRGCTDRIKEELGTMFGASAAK
jgi:hypothetical protein